jgi:uncharacterized membrane-anchored protein
MASLRVLARWVSPGPLAAKVPEIGLMFWVIKLLTTAAGEATSDYFGDHNVLVGAAAEVLLVAAVLILQLRTRRYSATAYWLLALAIAIFGTGAADTLHLAVGIPYAGTTILWAAILALVFWRWHRSEGTLSIHSITSRRREAYYWATVFATFALGTALGDFTATSLHLGFLSSAVMFGVIIAIPAVAWSRFRLNPIAAFWFAYVVTRPLGASIADYLSKPPAISGAGFGDARTSLVLLAAFAVGVAYLVMTRRDVQPAAEAIPPPGPAPAGADWPGRDQLAGNGQRGDYGPRGKVGPRAAD